MALAAVSDFLGRRLPVPQNRSDLIGDERILATARAVLAVSSLVAVYFDPTEPVPYASLAYGLLVLYSGYSVTLAVVLRFRTEVSAHYSLGVHTADVLWPVVISAFTDGPNSPFFLYFIFALLAAGFRWGMREALLTMVAATGAVMAEAFVLTRTPLAHFVKAQFNLNGFAMRAVYLMIFGALIGYLAESENRRRAEALSISRLSAKARVETGLKGTLQAVLQEMLRLFSGRTLLLVTSETETNRAYLWRTEVLNKMAETVFTSRQLDTSEGQVYLFPLPRDCAGAVWRRRNGISTIMIDSSGGRIRGKECYLPTEFLAQHRFGRVLMSTVSASPAVSARLFVFEPKIEGDSETQLHFLQNLLNQVTPAVYNVYLLRRLRSRAAAVERARVARDLHDGVVQSLHAIGFRLYALRAQKTMEACKRDQELLDIQQLVQNEAVNIRTLIQQLKPLDFDPRHLVDFLAGMIERYEYDTGIAAKFVCDLRDIAFPPHICREVASIIQEALVNVAKHSGAKNVLIKLALREGAWILTIDDDGRGFEFCGRFSHSELEEARRGPMIIRDRVRAIGGELSIDTRPGRGARLEITIPRQGQATIA
jgi:signal transduction histidine kinase